MASGGLWSWPSRPCEWPAKRLRGRPVSRTVTLRRARPSCRAPARPAKLPPMMMTSSMVMGSVLGMGLEKPSSLELSVLGSTGRQPHHALGGRLQQLLRQLLVIESAREDHRADHCRKNRHGLAAGLLALSFVNPKAEHLEVFPDPGFE